jgi:imidazolonepropionase-like amidohydrolase
VSVTNGLLRRAVACFALLLAAACDPPAGLGTASGPPALILAGGFVVDPDSSGEPLRADVLVAGGRIVAVGRDLDAPGARRIDVAGRYLAPGLWDMHAHVAAVGPVGESLEDYVRHGVLAIRDMGGRQDEILALRQDVASGRRLGPTMFVAGPTVNGEHSADFHRLVRNAGEARAAVAELRRRGVDFIKIHRQTSREAFFAIRDATRSQGMFFAGHVPLALDWIEASDAGMQSFEHVQTIIENELERGVEPVRATFEALERLSGERGDRIFEAMARNRTHWTPTLIFYETSWREDSPERRALKQRAYAMMRPLVGRAARADVPILAGTDLLAARGAGLLDELDRLVAAGLSPREALAAATTTAFRLAGRGPGPIRPGGEASLIVLRANPLATIENVRALSGVLLRGRWLGEAELRPALSAVQRPAASVRAPRRAPGGSGNGLPF